MNKENIDRSLQMLIKSIKNATDPPPPGYEQLLTCRPQDQAELGRQFLNIYSKFSQTQREKCRGQALCDGTSRHPRICFLSLALCLSLFN